jgi:diphthamide synthase subunit DPH2
MKIFIICSKHFYHKIPEIKNILEEKGHQIHLPNSFDAPFKEEEMKLKGKEFHQEWKSKMLAKDKENILPNDAVLVLNLEKNGQENYIGGATFLEIYKAWELNKKIYLYNPIPKNILEDELKAFNPIIINQNLEKIK